MKKLLLVAGMAVVLGPLGACADDYYARSAGGGAVDVAYASPVGYDGFYDDYYGPFYDGYWGDDGGFWYTDAAGHPYHRDTGGHFRHDQASGFHAVHGTPHASGGGGDHGGDRR